MKLSVDINDLLFQAKTTMFLKLVAVHSGLKMQYDMLKTDLSKQELINSTINLAGYSIVTDLTNALNDLHTSLNACNISLRSDNVKMPTLSELVSYQLSVTEYLKSFVIDWSDTNNSKVLDMVKQYATVVTDAVTMLKGLGFDIKSLAEFNRKIEMTIDLNDGKAVANELQVLGLLKSAEFNKVQTERNLKVIAIRQQNEKNKAEHEARLLAEHQARKG
ncbi:hypothetical protein [Hymenobacter lapidiphilus]|uniref:hypothetical protein n=1 Tax=Hymenobacter sp. CCM 8763 TaxID=2303334 RepID=UPI0011C129C5|nr:hypothetical protein [Hymenobacter sp. CCM 8763]